MNGLHLSYLTRAVYLRHVGCHGDGEIICSTMDHVIIEKVARRFNPSCCSRGDSYVIPFYPGEPLAHVATLRDRGDFFLDGDGLWKSSTELVPNKDGAMDLPDIPRDAKHSRYMTWCYLVFPKRMSEAVSETLRAMGTFLAVREGAPLTTWTSAVDQGNDYLQGTSVTWSYRECSAETLAGPHHAPHAGRHEDWCP